MSSGRHILTFLGQHSLPPLPSSTLSARTQPAKTSFSRFCTKTTHRASDGTKLHSKATPRLHSTMTGNTSIWRGMWFAGSEGWVLSLSLLVRVLMRLQICSKSTRRGEVLDFVLRRHIVTRRANRTKGLGKSLPFTHIPGAYPPVIQAAAILARGEAS